MATTDKTTGKIVEPKEMDLKEFRNKGFLQEANRQFFHVYGLALAVNIDDITNEVVGLTLYDYRDNPEGIMYDEKFINTKTAVNKAQTVRMARTKFEQFRQDKFNGSIVQGIDGFPE